MIVYDYDIWPDWVFVYSDEAKQEQLEDKRWYFFPDYPYWIDTNVGYC